MKLTFTVHIADVYFFFFSFSCMMVLFFAFHVIALFKYLVILVKGIRIDHPKIGHFGIRIILNGKQLRKSRFRKSSPSSFLPKCRVYIFLCEDDPHPLQCWKRPLSPLNNHYHCRQKVSTKLDLHKQNLLKHPSSTINFPRYLPVHNYHPYKPSPFFFCLVTSPLFIALC